MRILRPMAEIRPFQAQRYTEAAGKIEDLVAPPYDVISPEERAILGEKSPYNIVWLTLPESLPDDRSKFVKYARSAARLAEWRRDGILGVDAEPGIYRFQQTFLDPWDGIERTRTAMVVLLKLEPYEKGVVLPHEQTFPKHKEDRLRLLEATRTHLECIFGLVEDDDRRLVHLLEEAPFGELASVRTEDGVSHGLSRCVDEEAIQAISRYMMRARVWIADGHHRYETALKFRESLGPKEGPIPEDYILIALSSMKDTGLTLLPTHRIVSGFTTSLNEAKLKLETYFNTRRMGNDELPEAVKELSGSNVRAFGIVLPGQVGLLATMDDPSIAARLIEGEGSNLLKQLDVSILHEIILKRCFGVEGLDRISYTRDPQEAIRVVESSQDTMAVLTNPPSVEDMRKIAEAGEKMPQKSTYYYPKMLSGLVTWSLQDS